MSLLPINPEDFPDVPTRKALIAIDLQNDFLSEDGALPVTQPDGMIDRIVNLAEAIRDSGYGEIVWVRSQFDTSRPVDEQQIIAADTPQIPIRPGSSAAAAAARSRRPPSMSPPLEADPEAFLTVQDHQESNRQGPKPLCVRQGTKGAEFFPAIAAAKGPRDYAMTKSYYSAFETKQLVNLLRKKFATELFICGALSNVSVYATTLAASSYGFDITIVEDCCGYRSEMRHMNAARKLMEMTGCEFSTAANVIPSLRPKTPPETPPKAAVDTKSTRAAQQITPELLAAAIAATGANPSQKGIPVRHRPSSPRVGKARSTEEEGKAEKQPITTGHLPAALSIHLPLSVEKLKLMPESSVSAIEASTTKTVTLESKDDTAQSADEQAAQPVEIADAVVKNGVNGTPEPKISGTAVLAGAQSRAPKPVIQGTQRAGLSDVAQTPPKATSSQSHKSCSMERISPSTESPQSGPSTFKVTEELLVAATPQHMMKGDYTRNKADKLAATGPVCEGDTTLTIDFLPPDLIEGLFERLCEEVQFRKMMHQGGEVPRFIAVQGEVDEDGTQPVYRHPADESPPLLPFTPAVQKIREHVQKALDHPVNHVLIQCYRGGNDYISEHSDKTLDIVPNSYIANVSLGAERTMIFRTKRGDKKIGSNVASSKATGSDAAANSPNKRQAVRLPMPHNSLIRMGLATNGKWLHGIKADKRPHHEKTGAELAWDGVRISLTFRHIGTFLSHSPYLDAVPTLAVENNETSQYIWGQGAVAKARKDAHPVINGQTVEAIAMLKAFGKENNSPDFDWEANYGGGFDVLHMKAAPRYFGCGNRVTDIRVKLALAECGVKYAKGNIGSSSGTEPDNVVVPVKFVVDDLDRTTVVGDMAILLFLDAKYPKKRSGGDAEMARVYNRLYASLALGQRWAAIKAKLRQDQNKSENRTLIVEFLKSELAEFEAWTIKPSTTTREDEDEDEDGKKEDYHIADGINPSIADFALWPVLFDIVVSWGSLGDDKENEETSTPFADLGYQGLDDYYKGFGRRESVVEILRK